MLNKQLGLKGTKLNQSGVEVQGQLDIEGARMVNAMKEGMHLDTDALEERIADCQDRMGEEEETVRNNAAIEYQGLMLAKQYHDDIKASKDEEAEMRHELRLAKESVKGRNYSSFGSREGYREYVRSTENAIRENQAERMEKYYSLIAAVSESLKTSIARAKDWREQQIQRAQQIHHNANSDLEGVATCCGLMMK